MKFFKTETGLAIRTWIHSSLLIFLTFLAVSMANNLHREFSLSILTPPAFLSFIFGVLSYFFSASIREDIEKLRRRNTFETGNVFRFRNIIFLKDAFEEMVDKRMAEFNALDIEKRTQYDPSKKEVHPNFVREEGDKIVQEFRQTFDHVILASAGYLTRDEIRKAFLEALKSSSWAKWYVFDHLSPPQKKSFKYMIGEDLN